MTAKTQSPLTVYYDGACPVCRREIGFYQKRTGAEVSYCDVAAEACPAPDLTREEALKRFHVRLADGALVSGAAAFLALWRETPGFRLVGAAALRPARRGAARRGLCGLPASSGGYGADSQSGELRKLRPEIGDHPAIRRCRRHLAPGRHAMEQMAMQQHGLARR